MDVFATVWLFLFSQDAARPIFGKIEMIVYLRPLPLWLPTAFSVLIWQPVTSSITGYLRK